MASHTAPSTRSLVHGGDDFSDADDGGDARVDVAYRYLRGAILAGKLPAGSQMVEKEIATELGMSRTPVHEAMARLQEEGLVRIQPRKGVLVRALSPADLLEIYDVLIAVEGAAAEIVAADDVLKTAALPRLSRSTENMDAALVDGDLEAWRIADETFHDVLVRACGNGRLIRVAATVSGQADQARRLTLHLRQAPSGSAAEHRTIIEALRAGDAAAAGEAARAHRRRAKIELVPILRRIDRRHL